MVSLRGVLQGFVSSRSRCVDRSLSLGALGSGVLGPLATQRSLMFALSIAAVVALPLTASAEGVNGAPKIHDGMHSFEERRAMLSLQGEMSQARDAQNRSLSLASGAGNSAAPSQPQLLLMERRRVKGATERLADAWFYDYALNETIHKIVDLATGEVRSSEIVIGTQLPLIESEIARAFDILLESASDRKALERAYKAVTGEVFENRSQVSYKAFVFHPDTVIDGLSMDARRCGINRCAQMLIYTHDNVALDTSPVVDLSTAKVLQNLELRAQSIVRREEAAL